MGIFPDGAITGDAAVTITNEPVSYGKEPLMDFSTGKIVMENGEPVMVEGVEALKVWIEKAIRTARYRWGAYTWNYGNELEDLIGNDLPAATLQSEVERAIKEALAVDPRIYECSNFTIQRTGDILGVEFTVTTTTGETIAQEVNLLV